MQILANRPLAMIAVLFLITCVSSTVMYLPNLFRLRLRFQYPPTYGSVAEELARPFLWINGAPIKGLLVAMLHLEKSAFHGG